MPVLLLILLLFLVYILTMGHTNKLIDEERWMEQQAADEERYHDRLYPEDFQKREDPGQEKMIRGKLGVQVLQLFAVIFSVLFFAAVLVGTLIALGI